jgi:imidazolonepropionase-like amidohydrolase
MKRAALLGLLCLTLRAEPAVFKGFTLIDGAGKSPLSGAAMIVDGGRILWVGNGTQLKIPAGATVTDLAGEYVMPGLISLHGHLSVVAGLEQNVKKFYTRENVAKNLGLDATTGDLGRFDGHRSASGLYDSRRAA